MTPLYLRVEHRQTQKLSPRLQQAVRLLQLSSLEFAQELQATIASNPFLEVEEDSVDERTSDLAASGAELTAHSVADAVQGESGASDDTTPAQGDDHDFERDSWQTVGPSESQRHDDLDTSAMNGMAVEPSLAEHLHGQLNVLPLSERDMALAKAIVESLDDDGYLRLADINELIPVANPTPPATPDELQIALKRVQSLEPSGVGARSVPECLLLQLVEVEDPEERDLARRIITDHMENLATKDTASLARLLQQPVDLVATACARIRRLDPRPGWRFGSADIRYVTPDIVVRKVNNVWTALLNPAVVPKVRLHKVYAEMLQRHREAANPELAGQLRDARWTVRNVEQRFATILGVAQAIVKRQHHFFDYGPLAMKPMGLREIADEIGVHESTVSRVTNNKYMATPSGLFELKYFFSRAMTATSGSAFSGTAIRGLIKEMLDNESSDSPLSDAEITRQLAQQGFVVARRTVTKYRHLLNVDSVERRRAASATSG